jgi:hypothetical protein
MSTVLKDAAEAEMVAMKIVQISVMRGITVKCSGCSQHFGWRYPTGTDFSSLKPGTNLCPGSGLNFCPGCGKSVQYTRDELEEPTDDTQARERFRDLNSQGLVDKHLIP